MEDSVYAPLLWLRGTSPARILRGIGVRTNRPFFIVGFQRSGTTLLQAMLMQLEGVAIPPETHFLGAIRRRYRLQTGTSQEAFERALPIIRHEICEHNELPVDWEQLERELRASEHDEMILFDVLLSHMQARLPECRRIGEKSPNHLLWTDDLLDAFPDSQAICIIRDGRDAAVSYAESLDSECGHLVSAIRWRHYQRLHLRLKKRYAENRYAWVRYEDLVTDPEPELRRLCDFLGEPFSQSLLEQHRRKQKGFAAREAHKLRTLEPVTSSRVARYRRSMSRSEIALFQLVAGRTLRLLGYDLDRVSPVRGVLAALGQVPRLIRSRIRWRRRVRRDSQVYASGGNPAGQAKHP